MAQGLLIIRWYVVLQIIGLVCLPLTMLIFRRLPDRGYPFSKALSILLVTYANWIAVSCGLAGYSTPSLVACLAALAAVSLYLLFRFRPFLASAIRENLRLFCLYEALFLLVFGCFLFIRGNDPNIYGTEKFMDFSFITGIGRSAAFPPQDQWLSGEPVNYYYFGYLILANLIRLAAVPPEYGYNLALATLAGLTFVSVCSIAYNLSRRLWVGLAAAVFMVVLGNLDGFREFLSAGSLGEYNWWEPSRVVGRGDTINEFPFFSLLHADLHPHVNALPFFMLMIASVMNILFHRERIPLLYFVYLAVLVGALWIMNPWDLPLTVILLWLTIGLWTALRRPPPRRAFLYLLAPLAVILVDRFVLYVPFHSSFESFSLGYGFRVAVTSLGQMCLVWGFFFFVLFSSLSIGLLRSGVSVSEEKLWAICLGAIFLTAVSGFFFSNMVIVVTAAGLLLATANLLRRLRERETSFVLLLILVAFGVLLGCEFFYVKDTYGDKLYRMNTLFKFYFQSWTLVSIGAACSLPAVFEGLGARGARRTWAAVFACLFIASLAYPVFGTNVRIGGLGGGFDLNGIAYMAREHPGDYEAVMWIKKNVKGAPVLLEATKDPYAYYSRISSNTGLPTVLGWGNHEGLWRGGGVAEPRQRDVAEIYNTTDVDLAARLLRKYEVGLVYVGELERQMYTPSGLRKFSSFMRPAWRGRDSVIYEFIDPAASPSSRPLQW